MVRPLTSMPLAIRKRQVFQLANRKSKHRQNKKWNMRFQAGLLSGYTLSTTTFCCRLTIGASPKTHLDRIRPIIRDARPTIGFSVIEATNARKVTVWNENGAFSEHDLQLLREAGCIVEEQLVNSIGITV